MSRAGMSVVGCAGMPVVRRTGRCHAGAVTVRGGGVLTWLTAVGGTLAMLALPPVVRAHHSLAMFDTTKTVTLKGTVYKFEWANPHVWLWVSVAQAGGAAQVWGLESGAPVQLAREGLVRTSFRAGDAVTVSFRPMRGGKNGGRLASAVFPDGHEYRSQDPALQEAPPGQ